LYDQWRSNVIPSEDFEKFYRVEHFDNAGEMNTREDLQKTIPVISDFEEILQHVNEMSVLGADRIILHNVNRMQEAFIQDAGRYLLKQ
jgi:coenzyme F420-dependent glucose-6-phosphate dehydrogenase